MASRTQLLEVNDAPLLRAWLMKRLAAMQASSRTDSDVDADILAEYVVALLQHDTSSADAKEMCRSELYDFLKDETGAFVEEVFEALALKSYLPGRPQPSKKPAARLPQPAAPTAPTTTQTPRVGASVGHGYGALQPSVGPGLPMPPANGNANANGSRKRSYNESSLPAAPVPGGPAAAAARPGDRAAKQARRGGRGNGCGGAAAQPDFSAPAHSGLVTASSLPQYPPAPGTLNPGAAVFQPGFPMMPAGMPLNGALPFFSGNSPVPQHLVENLMRMQQQLEMALSSYNAFAAAPGGGSGGGGGGGGSKNKRQKRVRRCRNLEKKGVCNKVNCRFDHTPAGAAGGQTGVAVVQGLSANARKETIVVEHIPDEFLNEGSVRNHFSVFGTIVDIMVQPENSTAIVEFDTPAAASRAVMSPKTIFDNRFVTVSRLDDKNPQQLPQSQSQNQFGTLNYDDEEEGEVREATPELDMEEFTRKQEAAQKEYEAKKRLLEELAEQQQSVDDRLKSNLAKQLELRKKIVANMSARSARLNRTDSQQSGGGGGDSGTDSPSSSKSAAQALQTELIRAQLETLETEAKLLGIDPDTILGDQSTTYSGDDWSATSYSSPWPPRGGSYGGRGRGGSTPRGRGGGGRGGGRGGYQPGSMSLVYAAYSLDNRPRRIAVSGCDFSDPAKSEALRQYLLGVGDFSAIDTTTDDSAIITFGDRRTAEIFYYGLSRASGLGASADSKAIPGIDEPVELSWVAGPVPRRSNDGSGADAGSGSGSGSGNNDRNGVDTTTSFIMKVEDDELEEGEEREDESERHREEEDRRHRTRLQRQNMDFDVADEGDWDQL